jgi:hypothetical protein
MFEVSRLFLLFIEPQDLDCFDKKQDGNISGGTKKVALVEVTR